MGSSAVVVFVQSAVVALKGKKLRLGKAKWQHLSLLKRSIPLQKQMLYWQNIITSLTDSDRLSFLLSPQITDEALLKLIAASVASLDNALDYLAKVKRMDKQQLTEAKANVIINALDERATQLIKKLDAQRASKYLMAGVQSDGFQALFLERIGDSGEVLKIAFARKLSSSSIPQVMERLEAADAAAKAEFLLFLWQMNSQELCNYRQCLSDFAGCIRKEEFPAVLARLKINTASGAALYLIGKTMQSNDEKLGQLMALISSGGVIFSRHPDNARLLYLVWNAANEYNAYTEEFASLLKVLSKEKLRLAFINIADGECRHCILTYVEGELSFGRKFVRNLWSYDNTLRNQK